MTGLTTKLVAAVATLGLIVAASPGQAAEYTLKIAHVLPDGDPRDLGSDKVAEIMSNSKKCDMRGTVFPAAQLCSHTDCIEGVQLGSHEMTVMPASFSVGLQPLIGIFDFPFFWPRDRAKLLDVEKSNAMRKLLDSTDPLGIKTLGVWHTGYKIWTANKPLEDYKDFNGLKTRVMPSRILHREAELLGMTATTFPFPEVYGALQSGAIDAQANPIATTWQMKFHEVQRFATLTNHGLLEQLVMVNKKWWDGLPNACKSELMHAVDEGNKVTVDATNAQVDAALADFRKTGTKVVEVPEEKIAEMRKKVLPGIEEAYFKQTGEKGKDILAGLKKEIGLE